ncbi:unnamed protein product [Caenorhabditis bovis]|uniref:Uncharacterized protein n=1 Tax=Caenorhabditis bovis TaxID=2654633 RepID=A0A8S1EP47_9PELO|nr:unnamed protein product [Caenorhabditis bovis]
MGGFSTLIVLIALLAAVASGLPANPYRDLGSNCSKKGIAEFCQAENLFCLRSACSQCILRDPFNPFASFCNRLSSCVCSISNDIECEQKISATCY